LSNGIPIAIILCIAALGMNMASLIIRNLDEELIAKLRVQAAAHGNSIQEEVRCILRNALAATPLAEGLGSRISQPAKAMGGVDLELPARTKPPHSVER
jgi:plasmid stability protein